VICLSALPAAASRHNKRGDAFEEIRARRVVLTALTRTV